MFYYNKIVFNAERIQYYAIFVIELGIFRILFFKAL